MICAICDATISTKGMSRHLKYKHNMTNKDYYDKYLKQDNEGICPICNKETNFISLVKGYCVHCSTTCSSLDENVQQKLRLTNKMLYGVEIGFQTQKCIDNSHSPEAITKKHNTMLQQYNRTSFIDTEEVRQKITDTLQEKYNVTNAYQITNIKEKAIHNANTEQSKQKRYNTRKSNGWNKNQIEDFMKNFLDNYGYEFNYNWKSDKYPWKVDFYIKRLDLFVELNLFWTHGFHWYNASNIQDVQLVSQWKQKNNKYYTNAINIWTVKDIQKRDYAIQNNLNYVVIWNKIQLLQFLEDLTNNKHFIGFTDYNIIIM